MRHHNRYENRSGVETLISGIVLTGAFAVTWFIRGDWWWVFPLAFGGVLPIFKGIQRIIKEKRLKKISPGQKENSEEKKIFMIAKNENGIVTPVLIALHSDLSLEKAEEVLGKMVKNGHAAMNVLDSGRVEYEFPEFKRGIEKIE